MVPHHGPRQKANATVIGASILLINQTPERADAIKAILQKEGFLVNTAAPDAAVPSAESKPPDLVIIDQFDQPAGAVEMCALLRDDPHYQDVPTLVVGPPAQASLKERAFKAGAADWLDAPVQGSELLSKAGSCLELRRTRKNQIELEQRLTDTQNRLQQTEQALQHNRDHYEALIHDQTEALNEAKARAEEAMRTKSTFLSHMSHELRTPLNAILGFSRLMERNPNLTETQSENLRLIYQSGENLLRLINDALDMSRIDTGNEKLDSAVIDLHQFMQGVAVKFKSRAADKGLTLSMNLAPELPRRIRCDEHKLQQIMMNLLSNSMKFTQSGGIEIDVRASSLRAPQQIAGIDDEKATCDLVFEIKDTGPGIAEKDLERIFDQFYKAKSPDTSNQGAGLGLTVSRNFARLMGGDITAANRADQGACFTLNVSLEAAAADDNSPDEAPARVIGIAPGTKAYRVLVVDDDFTCRTLLCKILEEVGLVVQKAENGEQAIALFPEWMPDIVFMDMRMPKMDGLTATRRIKAMDKGRQTPVIALTGLSFDDDRREMLSAGCDDYLAKPLEVEQLFDVMTRHLDVTFIREGSSNSPESPPVSKKISIDDMARLPAPLLSEMKTIALELDLEKFKGCLDRIKSSHPGLSTSLSALSSRFRFEAIYNLCDGALKVKE